MSIVALDIATDTGVACWMAGTATPIFSTLRLPSDPYEVGRPMAKLRQQLDDLHAMDAITHLFFEASILPGATNINTVRKLCALAGLAELFAHDHKIKCREVEQQRWRKHFIGKGNGPSKELKRLAVEACHLRGWRVRTDHEADALGVLDYGLACFKISPPWRDAHLMGGAAK